MRTASRAQPLRTTTGTPQCFPRKRAQPLPGVSRNRSFSRACIVAQLSRQAAAVTRLRESFNQGMKYGYLPQVFPHSYSYLDPLHDYPPFCELLRPEG